MCLVIIAQGADVLCSMEFAVQSHTCTMYNSLDISRLSLHDDVIALL